SVAWPLERELATPSEIAAHRMKQQAWEEATQTIRDEMHSLAKGAFDNNQKYTVEQFPDDIQAIYNKPESDKTTYEKQLSYLVHRQAHRAATSFDYVKTLKDKPDKLERYQQLQAELKKFDSLKPAPLPKAFIATDIGPEPAPTFLLTRTTKEAVEPSFLTLLGQKPDIKPTATSTGRRTALANWIADENNPLSTRVIVNRVWQRHFGRGIVPTPNDFGRLGEPPSHPELLDWLTRRFLEAGWRIKPLHELIMNSAAYRQTSRRELSSEPTALAAGPDGTTDRRERPEASADGSETKGGRRPDEADPTNRLLWRFPPQRLDAEQVRDAMLAVSGELQPRDGGASVSGTSPHRSVYVKKLRNRPDEMLGGFDAPLGFESAPDRISTTTPIQSLLLVNGAWSLDRSRAFAKRLLSNKQQLDAEGIRLAYQLIFNRDATEDEVRESLEFLRDQAAVITAPDIEDHFPNETGLRPVTQHFGAVKDFGLGAKTLWIQPDSRFERLQVQKA
ncbi:MAG TPA: DUF1553 domain-containing protein, partial [Pirellulaceae bacterium]|nr:DUF1553 domain-containing protein [Pirellulaceae bacterium]